MQMNTLVYKPKIKTYTIMCNIGVWRTMFINRKHFFSVVVLTFLEHFLPDHPAHSPGEHGDLEPDTG